MPEWSPEQQELAAELLKLVRRKRYGFIYIESPFAVYGTPWKASDDDWEEIEGFDFGSEENLRAVIEHGLLPLTTDEEPIYYGDKAPEPQTGLNVWLAVPRKKREPISAELAVFWKHGATSTYPTTTRVHITKRKNGWEKKLRNRS
jgi:hypothetical protein